MMKYILTESQFNFIVESTFGDKLKNRMEYHFGWDKNKYPGADTYERFVLMKKYQPVVDVAFKGVKKKFPFEELKELKVATVGTWSNNTDTRVNVTLWPIIDETVKPISKAEFDSKYKKFQEIFDKNVRFMGLDRYFPQDGIEGEINVVYTFSQLPKSSFKL